MAEVTDLIPGVRQAGRERRARRRRPTNSLDIDRSQHRGAGNYCPACTSGLHVKCDDRMDFAFSGKTEIPCPCRCFNGTETKPRAIQDMMARQPEYAMQWLYIQSRLLGSVHVCSMDKGRVGP